MKKKALISVLFFAVIISLLFSLCACFNTPNNNDNDDTPVDNSNNENNANDTDNSNGGDENKNDDNTNTDSIYYSSGLEYKILSNGTYELTKV